ncbi:MAG: hypothetical protein B7Y41_12960 [Hydrogenophilales bacterium 28-61-23]|nr:MAG: hypothetical protein B7Y41_12960 [Hydrogenophilales bacterium 28-61-23]
MNATQTSRLRLVIVLVSLAIPSLAAAETSDAAPESKRASIACHMLMTEAECDQYKTALTRLIPGPERDRYLAEHSVMLKEREAACSCNRNIMANTLYPYRRQAMLRF